MSKTQKQHSQQNQKKQKKVKKSVKEYEREKKLLMHKYMMQSALIVAAEVLVGVACYFLTDFENQNIYLAGIGLMILIPAIFYRAKMIKSFGTQLSDVIIDGGFTVLWGGAVFTLYGNTFTFYAISLPLAIVTVFSFIAYLKQNSNKQ